MSNVLSITTLGSCLELAALQNVYGTLTKQVIAYSEIYNKTVVDVGVGEGKVVREIFPINCLSMYCISDKCIILIRLHNSPETIQSNCRKGHKTSRRTSVC